MIDILSKLNMVEYFLNEMEPVINLDCTKPVSSTDVWCSSFFLWTSSKKCIVFKERPCPKLYAHWSYQCYLHAYIGMMKHPHLSWFRQLMTKLLKGQEKKEVQNNFDKQNNGRYTVLKISITQNPDSSLYSFLKVLFLCVCVLDGCKECKLHLCTVA